MVVCPRCGSELREGARFCGKCGAAIKVIDEKKRICPVCGKELGIHIHNVKNYAFSLRNTKGKIVSMCCWSCYKPSCGESPCTI